MRALFFHNKRLQLKRVPSPEPESNEALIKVLKAGICNTDIEILKGYMNFEGILGHEFVGKVIKAGKNQLIGKRVVGEINIGCGKCIYCINGKSNHCPSRKVLGILKKDGVFAEFVTLPLENLHVVPESISNEEAVFTEPLAASLRILEQVQIQKGDEVLVLGDGKLGLLIAQVINRKGCQTFCLGKHKRKLKILQNKGIEVFLLGDRIKKKFDVVIETTGNKSGIEKALKLMKPEGRIVLKSTYFGKSNIDLSQIVINEIHIIGSRCGPFKNALKWLENKSIDTESLIDGDYPLIHWKIAFKEAKKRGNLKILFTMN